MTESILYCVFNLSWAQGSPPPPAGISILIRRYVTGNVRAAWNAYGLSIGTDLDNLE